MLSVPLEKQEQRKSKSGDRLIPTHSLGLKLLDSLRSLSLHDLKFMVKLWSKRLLKNLNITCRKRDLYQIEIVDRF